MPIGITFDETMTGGFALNEADPEDGAKTGKASGDELAMHATVTITDLDAFIADPKHLGDLSGTVDFAPLGLRIPAKTGIFNLFSPSREPAMKYMVYELAFSHGDKPYYLAGKKHVKDDFGFDLWSDTTTLYTRLHAGAGSKDPVVGAGILSLDMVDFMRLLSTLKVTGARSASQRAAAVAKFGQFFMGELWDLYGPEI